MGEEIGFVISRTSTMRTDMAADFQLFVMAGLDPAIHVFAAVALKTWMPGTSPGMTIIRYSALSRKYGSTAPWTFSVSGLP
jgi:hypothetical protein